MKSTKELIRSRMLRNINLFWGSKRLDSQDRMMRMQVENVINELYLLQNSIDNIDSSLLERLAGELTPQEFTTIRPAHAIAYITPDDACFFLERTTTLFMNQLSVEIAKQGFESLPFSPILDVMLRGLTVHLFKGTTWNTCWIGLEVHPEVDIESLDLQDLALYFEFSNLEDDHLYYELLPYIQWKVKGELIKMNQGYPSSTAMLQNFDQNILDYYHNSFLSIDQSLPLDNLFCAEPPADVVLKENRNQTPNYWIEIAFSHHFQAKDLEYLDIKLNAFPVSNKRYKEVNVKYAALSGVTSLGVGDQEHYMGIEKVIDNHKREYISINSESGFKEGSYKIEIPQSLEAEEDQALVQMERLIDLVHEERTAFPRVDVDKLIDLFSKLKEVFIHTEQKKMQMQHLKTEVTAKLHLYSFEDTNEVNISYWLTNGEFVNGLPKGGTLMMDKNCLLKSQNPRLITEIYGAKEFHDLNQIMWINKYILTSRDRIITRENIVDFCKSELGKLVDKISVENNCRISLKPKQGLIRTIEITLTPAHKNPEGISSKGIIRDLKTRLYKRSPAHFIYDIVIDKSTVK